MPTIYRTPLSDAESRSVAGPNTGRRIATNGSAGAWVYIALTPDASSSGKVVEGPVIIHAVTEGVEYCMVENTSVTPTVAFSTGGPFYWANNVASRLEEGSSSSFGIDRRLPWLALRSASTSAGEVEVHVR